MLKTKAKIQNKVKKQTNKLILLNKAIGLKSTEQT